MWTGTQAWTEPDPTHMHAYTLLEIVLLLADIDYQHNEIHLLCCWVFIYAKIQYKWCYDAKNLKILEMRRKVWINLKYWPF